MADAVWQDAQTGEMVVMMPQAEIERLRAAVAWNVEQRGIQAREIERLRAELVTEHDIRVDTDHAMLAKEAEIERLAGERQVAKDLWEDATRDRDAARAENERLRNGDGLEYSLSLTNAELRAENEKLLRAFNDQSARLQLALAVLQDVVKSTGGALIVQDYERLNQVLRGA